MANTPSLNQHAPSPALSHEDHLDSGFQHLEEYNRSVEATPEVQSYPEIPEYGRYPGQDSARFGHILHTDLALAGYSPYADPYAPNSLYGTPPLTTSSEDPYDGIKTRSGRSLGSPTDLKGMPSERIRSSRSPRVKKPKPTKTDKSNFPKLEMVLSELVKTYSDVDTEDMEAYVSREPAERQRKAQEKKRTQPPRPMNSFMLYRHCYSEVIKKYLAGKGNHQQVSFLAGKSWGNESDELRAKFQEYADMEKENHKLAFPNYHFKPKKDQNIKKRKKALDDEEDDRSDLDDLQSWGTPMPRTSNLKRQRRSAAPTPAGYEGYYQPIYPDSRFQPQEVSFNQSSFGYSNPGLTPPPQYHHAPPGKYYERTTTQGFGSRDGWEDVQYSHQSLPDYSHSGAGVTALPGQGNSTLLLDIQPHHAIDPALGGDWASSELGSGKYDDFLRALDTAGDPRIHPALEYYQQEHHEYQSEPLSHPGQQTLTGPMGSWNTEGGGHDNLNFLDQ